MATETIAPGSASAEAVETSTAPTADESPTIGFHTERFDYTGAVQKFVVPPGVTKIEARCWGSPPHALPRTRPKIERLACTSASKCRPWHSPASSSPRAAPST